MIFRSDRQGKNRSLLNRLGCGSLLVTFLIFSSASLAKNINTDIAQQKYQIDISQQHAEQALKALAKQTGIQLLFPYDLVKTLHTPALKGQYRVMEALEILLQDTGLYGGLTDSGVITISQAGTNSGTNQNGKGKRMNITTKKSLLASMVALFASGATVQAVAQSDENRPARALEEITVIATKKGRAENVQDIPIAVTAYGSDQIEAMHLENIASLGSMIPNTTLNEMAFVGGQASFFVRGMGVNSSQISNDSAVGAVVDGMSFGIMGGVTTDTFDLESITVLRGPQGTLFGRNATGGIVAIRSKRPTGEFEAKVRGTFGAFDRGDFAFSIENSLIENTLAGKLAVMYKDREGYFKNLQDPGNRVGDSRTQLVRPTLRFTPNEEITADLILEYGRLEDDGAPSRNVFDSTTFVSSIYQPSTKDLSVLDHERDYPDNFLEWKQAILDISWELGGGVLTSITAWRDSMQQVGFDGSGTGISIVDIDEKTFGAQDQVSQELRYAVDISDRVNITSGVYYFNQNLQSALGLSFFGGSPTWGDSIIDHRTYAVFTQSDIKLSNRFVLTLGGRYTIEKKDARMALRDGIDCEGFQTNCNYSFNDSEEWSAFSHRINLQWIINDNAQAYLSWNRGFRGGGYNAESTANPGPYEPETVDAYEVGLKTELFDSRVRANLAIFWNQYKDLQRNVFPPQDPDSDVTPGQEILNAAEVQIAGFEAEINVLVTEHFTLSGSLGLVDSEFDSFDGLDVNSDGSPDPELAKDLKLIRTPDYTYSFSGVYERDFSFGGLALRVDYSFTDERPGNDQNTVFLDEHNELNASATYYAPDRKFSLSAFGKNLTNDIDASWASNNGGFMTVVYPNAPRTWGVEVNYEF